MDKDLSLIYQRLYSHFGPQNWWPAKTPFEVIVGAILTQNTNWLNVEKAIGNLKKSKLLKPRALDRLPKQRLARVIRPAGYYNVKAARLKSFLKFFLEKYKGNINRIALLDAEHLRRELLSVNGIGPETADSIILYAFNKPIFVVDAYTKRIFLRHGLVKKGAGYGEIQELITHRLEKDAALFNEYHALLVKLGKEFCLKNNPRCSLCPLQDNDKP